MMKKKEVMLRSQIDDIDEELDSLKNCLRSVRDTAHRSFMLGADNAFCEHLDETVEVLSKRIGHLENKRAENHRELEQAFYARIQPGQKV
jgi:chaperonin cofactor prefoldin